MHIGFVSLTLQEHALSMLIGVLQEAQDAERVDLLDLTRQAPRTDEQFH